MELIFKWTKDYETKLSEVDEQHYYLVTVTNDIATKISEKALTKEELDSVFGELVEYAAYHFNTEEVLMKEKNIAKEFFEDHVKNHRMFVEQVSQLYSEVGDGTNKEAIRSLLEFLISWLGFHILGQDKNMGKQIELIDQGEDPDKAYEIVVQNESDQTAPLVKALNGLVSVVVKRNAELLEIKRNLELKVKERTRELAQSNQTLKALALTDTLTGLPNRRHLFEVLDVILKEAKENTLPTSGLMIDLDNFKEVNDNFGHEMGDKVLKEFSTALKDTLRTSDLAARLGGDEFFVLLPDTNLEGAKTLAENLISVIRKLSIQVGRRSTDKWLSSVSIGIATISPSEITNANDFMRRADMAVYQAKDAGKNCIKFYNE